MFARRVKPVSERAANRHQLAWFLPGAILPRNYLQMTRMAIMFSYLSNDSNLNRRGTKELSKTTNVLTLIRI